MAIPDFQSVMLPLVKCFDDGDDHYVRDLIDQLADDFQLTDDERTQLLPSGSQSLFRNRVGWAVTHLTKAGLIDRVGHGRYRIGQRGQEALERDLGRIDTNYLSQFPEYREFRTSKPPTADWKQTGDPDSLEAATPQETIESSYSELRAQLAQELLDEVKSSPPAFFEQLVVDLLVSMGYGGSRVDAGQAVGKSGDGGIDGIIKEDKLGLDAVYLQAKRWENPVGRPIVQTFAGSLDGYRANKGVLITTSSFSKEAHEYVRIIQKRIILIDGEQLAQLMIDHGIGVSEVQTYTIYRVDSDYFSDE